LPTDNANDKAITRGGNRCEPVHVALFAITTLLLIIASVCLIFHVAIIGIIVLLAAIAIAMWDFQRR
jgi:hypothetical protein